MAWRNPAHFLLLVLIIVGLHTGRVGLCLGAGPPRVLPPGEIPADTRLGPLKGEQGDFSFVPAKSREQWKQRAEYVRKVMNVTLGLWPMPTKTPMNPVIHGLIDQGDYTIEKVYFESVPGFYVTGNLYRPKDKMGRRPAVLSPHGHFPGGRFQDEGIETVRRKIAQGAERFEDGGRSFMQSRCVQLARMGCVVFHYDMIGYGDSVQIPLDVAHRFSQLRVKFKEPPAQGFYSASAELHLHNPMGLHTYNSIRALDFLISLPDVDSERIAVTGGSGGGTQTFMLCAVDDRPLVSVPVVIVSTTRQGGCTCENISGFRIGTYNLEITALHAPNPLLLISADDATRTMPERGFPELKQLYGILGATQNVSHVALLQFP
ncbi:MAG: acetylxylan esterase, partial [Sedimentisphaerales bacterium]|nr:acetylxylan esterase [Sedimentisphaerales bacterium]